ncbi:MAG: hypothetical protein J5691_00230 [Bacilli bacterium]|nr:hypothetical protein [Bacilli bacterium]
MKENQDNKQQPQKKVQISPTLPVNGCLWVIILAAIATMAVKGCKMVNMKYDEAKVKHEMYMDSINKVRNDTLNYRSK